MTKFNSQQNVHVVQPDIKIHTVVTGDMDFDHKSAMKIPLGEVSDEQLMAEVARRKLDLHDKITDTLVKETYDLGRILGRGASGEVLFATHIKTKHQYACKVVRKSGMNDAQSMSTEIEIMKRIRHRHVVSMYELYETPKCLWIILELVEGGDLFHHLAETPEYSEQDASLHMRQMLSGVHYLHTLGVVHRDLKLDNVLLSSKKRMCDVKLADFGLSALIRLGEGGYDPNESSKRKQYVGLKDMWGTKEYFAPEVIDMTYGPQADVWALGCILYEMLSGHQAFPLLRSDKGDDRLIYGRIKRGEYSLNNNGLDAVSAEAKDLLKGLLCVDPTSRLSATEALKHPWVMGDPDQRPEKALSHAHETIKHKLEERRRREEERRARRNQ